MAELTYYDTTGRWTWRKLVELWQFRELLWTFFQRDLTIRYRQVFVGVLWVLVQPALSMLIFIGLFWILDAHPTSNQNSYASDASVVFIGVWCWQLFASALRDGTGALVNYRHVITKVYFPRILLPFSSILCALFDFVVGSLVLIPVLLFSQDAIYWSHLWIVPFVILWLALLCCGLVAWLSSLNAQYRDVGYALPFALQIGMYLSPVVYDASRIQLKWQVLYQANPVAACISWMRWGLLNGPMPGMIPTMIAFAVTMLLLWTGLTWFERSERMMADRI